MESDKVKAAQKESKTEEETDNEPDKKLDSMDSPAEDTPLLDPKTQEPVRVAIPEVSPQAMIIEAPAIIKPVVVDRLDFIEPLPTKEDEEKMKLQEIQKTDMTEESAAAETEDKA